MHPLQYGMIADLDAAAMMLQAFFRQARLHRMAFRVAAVVCVPSNATTIDRGAFEAVAGSRRPRCVVRLVGEPTEPVRDAADRRERHGRGDRAVG